MRQPVAALVCTLLLLGGANAACTPLSDFASTVLADSPVWSAAPSEVVADGSSAAQLSVRLLSSNHQPLSGQQVLFSVSLAGAVLAPALAVSDANGLARAQLTSPVAGSCIVAATWLSPVGEVSLGHSEQVVFTAPVAAATLSPAGTVALTLSPNQAVANRVDAVQVDVLVDPPGATVTLSGAASNDVLSPAAGASDATGHFKASWTSSLAGARTLLVQGPNASAHANALFVAGPADVAHSTVVLLNANGTVVSGSADINAALLVQISLRDAFGNPVANQPVQLGGQGNAVVAVPAQGSTDANGLFVAHVTATQLGSATLSVQAGSLPIQQVSTTFVVGAPSVAHSTLVVSPNVVTAGGNAVITAQLLDASNHPVAAKAVTFVAPGSANVVLPQTGLSDGNGQVTAPWQPLRSGNYTLVATVAGLPATPAARVRVVAGPIDSNRSTFAITPNALVADGLSRGQEVVWAQDSYGNGVAGQLVYGNAFLGTSQFALGLTDGNGLWTSPVWSVSATNGARSIQMLVGPLGDANSPGTALDLNNTHFANDSFTRFYSTVNFLPCLDCPNDTLSTFSVTPPHFAASAGSTNATLAVVFLNLSGNAIVGQQVSFALDGGNNQLSAPSCTTDATGACSVTLSSTLAQSQNVVAKLKGYQASQTVVVDPASPNVLTLNLSPNVPVVANNANAYTVALVARDAFGNSCSNLVAHLQASGWRNSLSAREGRADAQGRLNFTLTSSTAEAKTLHVDYAGQVWDLPVNFVTGPVAAAGSLLAIEPSALAVGSPQGAQVTVLSADQAGNPVGGQAVNLQVTAGAATLDASSGVTDANGRFVTTLRGSAAGSATLTAGLPGVVLHANAQIYAAGSANAVLLFGGHGGPSPAQSDLWVVILDGQGQLATGYTGTVHFTSTDASATLPADYTFTGADAGQHRFAAGLQLVGEGTQSVTVSDLASPALAATQAGLVVGDVDYVYYTLKAAGGPLNQVLDTVSQDGTANTGLNANYNVGGYSQLWNFGTDATVRLAGSCLDALHGNVQAGVPLVLANCSAGPSQTWQLVQGKLRSLQEPGLCVASLLGASAGAVLAPCQAVAGQLWTPVQTAPVFNFTQANGYSFGWEPLSSGKEIGMYYDTASHHQLYSFAADQTVRNKGLCLQAESDDLATNPCMNLVGCTGDDNQRWVKTGNALRSVQDGNYCFTYSQHFFTQAFISACDGSVFQNVGAFAASSWRQYGPAALAANDLCMAADKNQPSGTQATLQACEGAINTAFFAPPSNDNAVLHLYVTDANNYMLQQSIDGSRQVFLGTLPPNQAADWLFLKYYPPTSALYNFYQAAALYYPSVQGQTLSMGDLQAQSNNAWHHKPKSFRLQAVQDPNWCLEVADAVPSSGTALRWVQCALNTPGQLLSFEPMLADGETGSDQLSFTANFGNRCVTANGGFVANANFVLDDCPGSGVTGWTLVGGNTFMLRNDNSLCLDAGTPTDGSLPMLQPCAGTAAQQFNMLP